MQKNFLIAGGTGFMRQYLVEGLFSDPENVVVGVDLLTPGAATPAKHQPLEDPRYEQKLRTRATN